MGDSVVDPRFVVPDYESQGFIKIVGVGYALLMVGVLINIKGVLRYPTSIFPNLVLLVGLLSPFFLMEHLAIPGQEGVSPMDPDVVTGRIDRDPFSMLRLLRWYNYEAINNPIGGPIVNAFAVLGMIFARYCGDFKVLTWLSIAGCAYLHFKYLHYCALQVVPELGGNLTLTQLGDQYWNDAMLTKAPTPGYAPLHEGKEGYMPASYAVDFQAMVVLALVYAVFDADSITGKLKSIVVTLVLGPGAGVVYAFSATMLPAKPPVFKPVCCLMYTVCAVGFVLHWLPFQMSWIDFVTTAQGRLGGGLINEHAKYGTLQVIAPYFALCAIGIAHFQRQKEVPTLLKGILFFNCCAFLFFHIAGAAAVMMASASFWAMHVPAVRTKILKPVIKKKPVIKGD